MRRKPGTSNDLVSEAHASTSALVHSLEMGHCIRPTLKGKVTRLHFLKREMAKNLRMQIKTNVDNLASELSRDFLPYTWCLPSQQVSETEKQIRKLV